MPCQILLRSNVFAAKQMFCPKTRRASRGHEAARSENLSRLLSDRVQTLHNDRTFYSKQSYRFCFFILTVFGGEMTSQC